MIFHVFIVTIGRDTLVRMLNSIGPQLNKDDILTVVYDGRDDSNTYKDVIELKFDCKYNIIFDEVNRGFWGHATRNIMNDLEGDFILHGDDDDIYTPGAMDIIRKHCVDPDTLYLFAILNGDDNVMFINDNIILGIISKQSGVIPRELNKIGIWGYTYSGDHDFYKNLNAKKIEWINEIIYKMRP